MLSVKKTVIPLVAAVALGFAVPAFASGETSTYTMQDGKQVSVDRQALAVYAKEKAKENGGSVNTLSDDDWDKIILDVSQLSDGELEKIRESFSSGKAYGDLSDEEMAALQVAYDQSSWGTMYGENASAGVSSDQRRSDGLIALAGILGGGAAAAGLGYRKRQSYSNDRNDFSLFSWQPPAPPKPQASGSTDLSGISVMNAPWENMQMADFPELTHAEAYSGLEHMDFVCDDWDNESEATKQFASMVGAAWYKMHPELPNLLVTSGRRYGSNYSHHDFGEAFDVANDYFEDKSLRVDYVNLIDSLGGTGYDEWHGEPGAKDAHGDNIHATTPNSTRGNGGVFSISDWC